VNREALPMKLTIVYDGACPFCDDYARHQKLRSAVQDLELIDARRHPDMLRRLAIEPGWLEQGMVVIADGDRHHGADAMHALSRICDPPQRAWVRWLARASRSRAIARALYPTLRLGRRAALAVLRIPRFPR
jgi:predicted DCC family thiol-disulfide oxidoreductase YuxK